MKILKIRDLIENQQLRVAYDFSMNQLPKDLMNLFSFGSDVQSTHLVLKSSHVDLLYLPKVKTKTYGDKSIKYHCAEL